MEMNYICLIMNECDHIVEVEAILSRESRVKRLLREVLSSPGADRTLGKNSLTLSIYIVLKRFRSIEDDACIDCERFLQSYKSTQSIAENIVEELLRTRGEHRKGNPGETRRTSQRKSRG